MNSSLSKRYFSWFLVTCLLLTSASSVFAQAKRFKAADSEGVTATRDKTTLYLKVDANVKGSIKIPRLAAPLAGMAWQGSITDDAITLKPEQDHWVINWKKRPEKDATLELRFGAEPLLINETRPIKAEVDGSFMLPAHLSRTGGKKIRYEPQPHKNTVGFWTGKGDLAGWNIELDRPGRFEVAILQGCGKGQGGSSARIGFMEPVPVEDNPKIEVIDFLVLETGHFQRFLWCHVGEIELKQSGKIGIFVLPIEIKNAALMDIRAIHLIRLPDNHK